MEVNQVKFLLKRLALGFPLTEDETYLFFESMLSQSSPVTDSQLAAYLALTGTRLVTSAELVGAARSLRRHTIAVAPKNLPQNAVLIDTCGTGGSGLDSFNTSTAVAFVVAAAGPYVAKHGNRGATSRSGSADVLEALGIRLNLTPEHLATCLEETHFCFMFAPQHHPATKRVQGIRRELGFRTIFNFLGPLVNPAAVTHQLLGVSALEMVPIIAEALQQLQISRAAVVCSDELLDEVSISSETTVCEVKNGALIPNRLSPEDFNIKRVTIDKISGFSPSEAAEKIRNILGGKERGAYRDLVVLNTALALHVAEVTKTVAAGIKEAERIIDSGAALKVLEAVIEATNRVH